MTNKLLDGFHCVHGSGVPEFENLLGKTLTKVVVTDSQIVFYTEDECYQQYFEANECDEDVWIESIVGDMEDLIGTPILKAEEVINRDEDKCKTYSFYKLATIKGYVDIRWVGESNGYYSETAYLARHKRNKD